MLCREMSDNNTYGLTTMNAMLTSQIVSVTVCSVQLIGIFKCCYVVIKLLNQLWNKQETAFLS